MDFIDLVDKHASAIFGVIGAIGGFFSNYFFKKLDRKYEISKEEAKEYLKQQIKVLNKILQLISKYEITIETLHDYYDDEFGVPIKLITKEDIYEKYFLEIFEYLDSNRFYLEKDIVKKLNSISKDYYSYILNKKVIISEYDNEDIYKELEKIRILLIKETEKNLNKLIEQIKDSKSLKSKIQ